MGWEAVNASKLNNSKSRASGNGWFVVTGRGREKASLHHESQSNNGVCSGKGSETVCFLGTHSDPRGLLTVGSPELDSDRRLFLERGGEGGGSLSVGIVGRGDKWEEVDTLSGNSDLTGMKRYRVSDEVK